jgi:hypothetical protein
MRSFLLVFLVGIGFSTCQSSLVSAVAAPAPTTTSKIKKGGNAVVTSQENKILQAFDLGAWANGLLGGLVGGGWGIDFGDDDSGDNSDIAWGNVGAWDDWLAALMHAGGDGGFGGFDFCTIVKVAIGMTPTFGMEADCDCHGDFGSGLEVDCAFNECAVGSEICGSVGLNFTLVVLMG